MRREGETSLEKLPGHGIKYIQVGLVNTVDREVELERGKDISAVDCNFVFTTNYSFVVIYFYLRYIFILSMSMPLYLYVSIELRIVCLKTLREGFHSL